MLRLAMFYLVGLLLLGPAVPGAVAAYNEGDIYLLSPSLPSEDGPPSIGIVKINPVTGDNTLFHEIDNVIYPHLVYDPDRDMLLYLKYDRQLIGVDSTGTGTVLANLETVPNGMAWGQGLVYMRFSNQYFYMDATGSVEPLLDEAGISAYSDGASQDVKILLYDEGTNSLLVFSQNESNSPCGGWGMVCASRIPLNAAGTQVAGEVVGNSLIVSSSGNQVVGVGHRTSGGVLFVIDTNSNNEEPRMQLLDPVSMNISAYASSGPYTGAAAVSAGTYSNARGQALMLDSFSDCVRAYSAGSTGEGTVVANASNGDGVSSSGGHSERARMVEIMRSVESAAPPAGALLGARLLMPHPNPFNPSTTLRFEIDDTRAVQLDIFDVRGSHVRSLIDGVRGEGSHAIVWDGRFDDGQPAPSGVYFARLRAGSAQQVQRMVLVE